jgi:predicted aconitase
MELTREEHATLSPEAPPGVRMAMRIVVEAARLLGARRLVPVTSAHVDGCLYHGDAGVRFAERLAALEARVAVPTTLNVGALDLLHPEVIRAPASRQRMARRQMDAYAHLGCRPTWTCAPYQAGHRPALGQHVAWGESNAVAFVNSVLGARTNRLGDFLDVCCAITGRAPCYGLHLDESRQATVHVDLADLPAALREAEVLYPVLGAWLGSAIGSEVAAITGIDTHPGEDALKALGAGAASGGGVALFHVVGLTPEARTLAEACGGRAPRRVLRPGLAEMTAARDGLSTCAATRIDCVAVGSPHFSLEECRRLASLLPARPFAVPFYVCTRRDVLARLEGEGLLERLEAAGVRLVVDTCVVVTPILEAKAGVMMTSSAKFAHYGPGNTGHETVFGSLEDCVTSATTGRVARAHGAWE